MGNQRRLGLTSGTRRIHHVSRVTGASWQLRRTRWLIRQLIGEDDIDPARFLRKASEQCRLSNEDSRCRVGQDALYPGRRAVRINSELRTPGQRRCRERDDQVRATVQIDRNAPAWRGSVRPQHGSMGSGDA